MRKGREIVMMVGIVLLMSIQLTMPSFAQDDCWKNIGTCIEGVDTTDELKEECCKVIFEEINTEKECFCSIKPIVDSNVTTANTVSEILSLCEGLASFDTICSDDSTPSLAPQPPSTPDSAPSPIAEAPGPTRLEEAECWVEIDQCIEKNSNRSELEPTLNPDSPAFNLTEFLCCPLMQQTAVVDKPCFCAINTFIQENPVEGPNITLVLSACNIASSTASLNNFCQDSSDPTTQALSRSNGEASSPNSAPIIRPSPGTMETISEASIVTTMKTTASSPASSPTKSPSQGETGEEKSGANKITTIGSLSGLFVIFTYVLFH